MEGIPILCMVFEDYDDNRLMSKVPQITCNEILSTDLNQRPQLTLFSINRYNLPVQKFFFSVRPSPCIRIYFEMTLMLATTSGLRKIAL